MQGVEANYMKFEGLSTLNIFDHLGFQYYLDVRPSATFTNKNIEDPIHRLLSIVYQSYDSKKQKRPKICIRADSGYYNTSFINACVAKNADVLVAVNQGHWFYRIANQVSLWQATNKEDAKRIKFYDGPECEIGSTVYRMKEAQRRMRYVIMRAEKKADETSLFSQQTEYDYYAFCTTYSENLFRIKKLFVSTANEDKQRTTSKKTNADLI